MTPEQGDTVAFETTLSSSGNNTGIPVPEQVIERLGHGGRPPVLVTLNGHAYRSTVAVMGDQHLIGVSAAIRAATGLKGGDPIRVTLKVADEPREVEVPADFASAMDESGGGARDFFDALSNSLRRYHVDTINAAKAPETRQRRIDKAVALFLAGKQR
jgi:hypothetical protein